MLYSIQPTLYFLPLKERKIRAKWVGSSENILPLRNLKPFLHFNAFCFCSHSRFSCLPPHPLFTLSTLPCPDLPPSLPLSPPLFLTSLLSHASIHHYPYRTISLPPSPSPSPPPLLFLFSPKITTLIHSE